MSSSCEKPMLTEEEGFKQDNRMRIYCVGLVMLVFFSTTTSVVTLAVYLNERGVQTEGDQAPTCLPCHSINLRTLNDTGLRGTYDTLDRHKDQDNIWQCCAKSEEQKAAMTEMVLKLLSKKLSASDKNSQPHSSPVPRAAALTSMADTFGSSLAYAQKSLLLDRQHHNDFHSPNIPHTDKPVLLSIEPTRDVGRYELSKGVELLPTGIRVKLSGLYFVYKSVHFLPHSAEPCSKFPGVFFKSFLERKTEDRSTVLIKSIHTCCPGCERESETGFTGGVFELNEGDIIQVKVSGALVIHVGRDVTYVGLIMMGGRRD